MSEVVRERRRSRLHTAQRTATSYIIETVTEKIRLGLVRQPPYWRSQNAAILRPKLADLLSEHDDDSQSFFLITTGAFSLNELLPKRRQTTSYFRPSHHDGE